MFNAKSQECDIAIQQKRRKALMQALIIALIFACFICLRFAFADEFSDQVMNAPTYEGDTELSDVPLANFAVSIFGFVIKMIVLFVINIFDALLSPVKTITTLTMTELGEYIPITTGDGNSIGDIANKVLLGTGLMIWIALSCFAILADFIYVAEGSNKAQPPEKLFVSIVVTGILTYKAHDLMFKLFDSVIQPLTSGFLDSFDDVSAGDQLFQDAASSLFTTNPALSGVPGMILALLIIILIAVNFFKLALEMVQRYVILAFICVLSPLAFSTGSNQETSQIAKQWFRMFWSQGVLLFLNVWCIAIGKQALVSIGDKSADDILIWALVTYGFLKVALQLDDILNNAGLSITRQATDLFYDLQTAGSMMRGAVNSVANGAHAISDMKKVSQAAREGNATAADFGRVASNLATRNPFMAAAMSPFIAAAAAKAKGDFNQSVRDAGKALAMTNEERKANKSTLPATNSNAMTQARNKVLNKSQDSNISKALAAGGTVEEFKRNDKDGTYTGQIVTRDKDGNVESVTGFKISGNGKEAQALSTGVTTFGRDEKGNAIITDSERGTFKVTQDQNDPHKFNVSQVADKDGNKIAEGKGLDFSYSNPNVSGDGAAAEAVAASGGIGELMGQKEAAQNFASMSPKERLDANPVKMDMNTLDKENAEQLNNLNPDILNDNATMGKASYDDKTGKLTRDVVTDNGNGMATRQTYEFDNKGAHEVGSQELYKVDNEGAHFQNASGAYLGQKVGQDQNGNDVWAWHRYNDDHTAISENAAFTTTAASGTSAMNAAMDAARSPASHVSEAQFSKAVQDFNGAPESVGKSGINDDIHRNAAASYYTPPQGVAAGSAPVSIEKEASGAVSAVYATSDGMSLQKATYTPTTTVPSKVETVAASSINGDGAITTTLDGVGTFETKPVGSDPNTGAPQFSTRLVADAEGNMVASSISQPISMPTSVGSEPMTVDDAAAYLTTGGGAEKLSGIAGGVHKAQEDMRTQASDSLAGNKVDDISMSTAVGNVIAEGNCDNKDVVEAMQTGKAQLFVSQERNDEGKITGEVVYSNPSDNNSLYSVPVMVESDGKNVNVVTGTASRQASPAEIEESWHNFAESTKSGENVQYADRMESMGLSNANMNTEDAYRGYDSAHIYPETQKVVGIESDDTMNQPRITTCETLPDNSSNGETEKREVLRHYVVDGTNDGMGTLESSATITARSDGTGATTSIALGNNSSSDLNVKVTGFKMDSHGSSFNIDVGNGHIRKISASKYRSPSEVVREFSKAKDMEDLVHILDTKLLKK